MRRTLYDKFSDFDMFRACVRHRLTLFKWTYQDLSELTGYEASYIANLMCGRGSMTAAKRIAKQLEIDPDEYE